MKTVLLSFRQVNVKGISTFLVEGGDKDNQPILFLHGYPETSMEFENVMMYLASEYYVLAIDLPGIGSSEPLDNYDKLSIADFVKDLLIVLKLQNTVVVGHDIGGMVAYSLVTHFPEIISKVVIIGTSVPGVVPWEEVKRNPHIWHFAFYAVPELPEELIKGKENVLFDFFYTSLSYNKEAIKMKNKETYIQSYKSSHSLKTALGWYRTFPEDEKENGHKTSVDTPVLYLKGDKDFGDIDHYIRGFLKRGLKKISGESVPYSGHFSPEENPEFVVRVISEFISKK
ncbi:alpha/beta fold hydrolase [Arachidicoccus terrestris]|uniref:alpha/beta fold hydrolase n=1 Tax=Arachidicoccus terrestris TaxID=2875539 RepID=UPI001CC4165B|nr:alpha/beta hydrolase [Arachidicoccus terrestris]UAY55998.1 alpha/beta hydrolase [Arachidicoccus terrestris]